jgi:hypothetical protein
LVEQHRPIDENLDPLAHWKKQIGLQKHGAAADVQRCGVCSISSQDVFRPGKDRVSRMLPTFRLSGAGPGLYIGVRCLPDLRAARNFIANYSSLLKFPQKSPQFSRRIERAAREVEAEVKRAVEYIETNILPKARRDGEKMLRRLSEELSRWADRLNDDEAQNK